VKHTFENAFITGASSGLGRAIALELARRGTRCVLAARRLPELEQLAAEIRAAGGRADVCELDVRDTPGLRSAMDTWDRTVGGFDLVLANAGIGLALPAAELVWEDVEEVIEVNFTAALATLIEGKNLMLPRCTGTLVGMSSLAGERGMPGAGAYAATKAGLQSFLETLEIDLRRSGLTIVDIQPGFVRTPMTDANTGKMPFLMEVERAAVLCVDGIQRGDSVISFPWQLSWLARGLVRYLPRPVWRWIAQAVDS